MSFAELDEAPPRQDEPSPQARPSRPTRPSGPQRRAVLRRRLLAMLVGAGLLLLLVIATRGCLDARADRAYSEYASDVTALSNESLQQSQSLFEVMRDGGGEEAVELQNNVNGFRTQADQLVERARALDPPDRLAAANRFLTYSLEYRRDGLAGIATALPTALGEEDRDTATARIAREMRDFLVSDVLFDGRVAPQLREGLAERDLALESELAAGDFLPGIDWLEESTVSERVGALREGEVAAGARGLALGVVTAGGETLNESAPTQVAAEQDLAFSVQVQNQGAVPEEEVEVSVSITGGAAPLAVERTLESIPAGGAETATLPLADTPPTGKPVTVTIKVEPTEGESRTDDNESSFPATFVPG